MSETESPRPPPRTAACGKTPQSLPLRYSSRASKDALGLRTVCAPQPNKKMPFSIEAKTAFQRTKRTTMEIIPTQKEQSNDAARKSAQMSVEDIGKLNRKHKRQPEQFAQEIMAHIQTKGTFPPFPQKPFSSEMPTGGFSSFPPQFPVKLDLSFAGQQEIDPDFFPAWIADYCKAVAANTLTPVTMSTLVALSTLSTALAGKAVVQGRTRQHKEELMIWTVTVLPPGNLKSPVFKAMTLPIVDWQEEDRAEHEAARNELRVRAEIAAKKIESLKKQAADSPDDATIRSLLSDISKEQELIDAAKPEPKLFVSKGTPEAIRNELQRQEGKLAVLSAEGGIFDLMTGQYNNNQADLDLWLAGYFAEHYEELRVNASYKFRPRITFGLTVQPVTLESLGENAKGTRGQVRDRGILGRFIFGVPQSLVGQRCEMKPVDIPASVEEAYKKGLRRLLAILPEHENTPEGKVFIPTIGLSPEAAELYENFWKEIEGRHGTDDKGNKADRDLEPIQDWTTKTQGSVLRIAGVIHFAKHFEQAPQKEIDAESMAAAIRFYRQAIPHAQAAYALIGDTTAPVNSNAVVLFEHLKRNRVEMFKISDIRENTDPDLAKLSSKRMKAEHFHQTLTVLERAGVVSAEVEIQTSGRPAKCRFVNPSILNT